MPQVSRIIIIIVKKLSIFFATFPLILVTFETFDQSDEGTWPDKKDKDNDIDKDNDKGNDKDNPRDL